MCLLINSRTQNLFSACERQRGYLTTQVLPCTISLLLNFCLGSGLNTTGLNNGRTFGFFYDLNAALVSSIDDSRRFMLGLNKAFYSLLLC